MCNTKRVNCVAMKELCIILGVLGFYALIALFFFWLFTGAFGDWLAYGIGAVLISAYVLGAALGLWK